MINLKNNAILTTLMALLASCSMGAGGDAKIQFDTLRVTSTAYNITEAQTKKGNIGVAAWGDTLKPGMRAIAVSRDLLDSGLVHNSQVYIEGFDKPFYVKDKMNKRWRNKIDIFMGLNIDSARSWGKREINVYIPVDTLP